MSDELIIIISVLGIMMAMVLVYLMARTKENDRKLLVVQIATGVFIIAGFSFGLAVKGDGEIAPLKILMFDAIILAAYLLGLFAIAKLRKSGRIQKGVSTRKIAFLGIMVGLSSALMLLGFPGIPGFTFLKVELSALMIFMTFLWFDFKTAVFVSLATNLIHVFMPSTTPPLIPFMDEGVNFIATMVFLAPTAIFLRRHRLATDKKWSPILWLTSASVILTVVVMVLYNHYINLPLIYGMNLPFKTVLEVFGVFNLVKWGLNGLVINLLWRRLYTLRAFNDKDSAFNE